MTTKESKFWSVNPDEERLTHTSIDEAIGNWLDNFDKGQSIPETVTVYGFAPMELPWLEKIAGIALTAVLEKLDEEYGDPDGDYSQPTPKMRKAALDLAHVIRDEYDSWACRVVEQITVRVADFVEPEEIQDAVEISPGVTTTREKENT